jgi:hypothetical protein
MNADTQIPPAPEPTPPAAQAAPLQTNGLGVAALVIGIVAAVLSFIPLIQYVMGFVAFIGLVLGLVALFLKGRKKGIAIAGTIVSLVALILSFVLSIAYTDSFIEGFNDAVEESTTTVEVLPDDSTGDSDEPVEEGSAASTDEGTRNNPLPLGTTITLGSPGAPEWEITVGPATLNATDIVLAENQFNDPPEDGRQYALLNLTATYVGETSATPWSDISVSYVGADGVTYESYDTFAVAPEPFSDINELFPGGSGSGNVVIAIPSDTAADGTWRIGAWFLGEDLFFAAE